jgi:signal transduction histidine kinase
MIQVFQNLVGNAIKFRADRVPLVRIGARDTGRTWLLTVADNGIGIPADAHERIFAVFQRLHPRSRYEGSGIGLAITKKIVERHGGRMRVDSVVGEGTTFTIELPKDPAG